MFARKTVRTTGPTGSNENMPIHPQQTLSRIAPIHTARTVTLFSRQRLGNHWKLMPAFAVKRCVDNKYHFLAGPTRRDDQILADIFYA